MLRMENVKPRDRYEAIKIDAPTFLATMVRLLLEGFEGERGEKEAELNSSH